MRRVKVGLVAAVMCSRSGVAVFSSRAILQANPFTCICMKLMFERTFLCKPEPRVMNRRHTGKRQIVVDTQAFKKDTPGVEWYLRPWTPALR